MAFSLGSDLSCVQDIDPGGLEVSEKLCLVQAIARRLMTPRGRLIDDSNYGYDLSQWLGADIGPAELAQIRTFAQAECLKDERVQSVTITVTFQAAVNILLVQVALVAAQGPFQFVLAVSQLSTQILTVTP